MGLSQNGQNGQISEEKMIKLSELSRGTGIPRRTLSTWCSRGMIPGAKRVGNTWRVPAGTAKAILSGRITYAAA